MWERAVYPLGRAGELLCRGMVFQHLEMHQEALADLTKVINQSNLSGKLNRIQYCYYRRGFAQKALKMYERATSDFETAK